MLTIEVDFTSIAKSCGKKMPFIVIDGLHFANIRYQHHLVNNKSLPEEARPTDQPPTEGALDL